MKRVLVVGNPNCGKSAIINKLTGTNLKVANYAGITVDIAHAKLSLDGHEDIELVDLPGTYSLIPHSYDEAVTVSTVAKMNPKLDQFDALMVVLDYFRLESGLSLLLFLKDFYKGNIFCVVNKCDQESHKKKINAEELQKKVPVMPFSVLNDEASVLKNFIKENIDKDFPEVTYRDLILSNDYKELFKGMKESGPISFKSENKDDLERMLENYNKMSRSFIDQMKTGDKCRRVEKTVKVDRILLHPVWGLLSFMAIFYFIFHALYTGSAPLMDFIDFGVSALSNFIGGILSDGMLKSLIVDGIIGGVGGIIVFLPQIMILFFILSLMEQSGYIARASILTDKVMSVFGLNGKAFLPFLSGFACSVPAIMATRTIKNRNERLATLMVLPFITCSARLPIFILLIGTFIPEKNWGPFNLQALAFFFMYFIGSMFALVVAKILRLSFFKGESSSFIIELPTYEFPSLKTAFLSSWANGKIFLKKVGTIVMAFSIIFWILSNFPTPDSQKLKGLSDNQIASLKMEQSYIGKAGKFIEPVIEPLGYDWKIGVGLIVSFGARELFVSAIGTLHALGDVNEESKSLRQRLLTEINPKTGRPLFNLAVAWSLLIFFTFACQCVSTLGVVKQETGKWSFAVIMFLYMGGLAWLGAFVTYHLLS